MQREANNELVPKNGAMQGDEEEDGGSLVTGLVGLMFST